MSTTTPLRLALEAAIVGVGLLALYLAVAALAALLPEALARAHWLHVVVAGGLFHILCELAGVNRWYCVDRRRRLGDDGD